MQPEKTSFEEALTGPLFRFHDGLAECPALSRVDRAPAKSRVPGLSGYAQPGSKEPIGSHCWYWYSATYSEVHGADIHAASTPVNILVALFGAL